MSRQCKTKIKGSWPLVVKRLSPRFPAASGARSLGFSQVAIHGAGQEEGTACRGSPRRDPLLEETRACGATPPTTSLSRSVPSALPWCRAACDVEDATAQIPLPVPSTSPRVSGPSCARVTQRLHRHDMQSLYFCIPPALDHVNLVCLLTCCQFLRTMQPSRLAHGCGVAPALPRRKGSLAKGGEAW